MLFVEASCAPTLAADWFAGESEAEPNHFSGWMGYTTNNDPRHEANQLELNWRVSFPVPVNHRFTYTTRS